MTRVQRYTYNVKRYRDLLSNAEGGEDEVKDIVGGGGAGELVEGAEGGVEIEEKHLVGSVSGGRLVGLGEGVERGVDSGLLADVGQNRGVLFSALVSIYVAQDLSTKFLDTLSSYCRRTDKRRFD